MSSLLTLKTVQAEWDAMIARVKEVAHVIEHAQHVHALTTAHIIIDPVGSDVAKAEDIIFWNLLFRPIGRVDDGRTVEISGEWLWSWRRYATWQLMDDELPGWFKDKRPELRMFKYRMAEQVLVEL